MSCMIETPEGHAAHLAVTMSDDGTTATCTFGGEYGGLSVSKRSSAPNDIAMVHEAVKGLDDMMMNLADYHPTTEA